MSGGWVDTRRLRAEILLSGRRLITGDIYLQLVAETHSGPESPVDLLNRQEEFFAVMLDGEQPVFLAKSQVLYVRLPPQPTIDDPDRESAARRLNLEIELTDGTVCEGLVAIELPPDRPRMLDFLNIVPGFFAMAAPEAVLLLNKRHIRAASPLAQVPHAAT